MRSTIAHIKVLSGIFVNVSSGYIGLIILTPIPEADIFSFLKYAMLAISFYLFAVRLQEVIEE